MLQAEARVDLDAIRENTAYLAGGTAAEVMAVVKADGYGHGMVPAARAALAGGATWIGACTLEEALALRASGITEPVFAWLIAPGQPLSAAVAADVDLSAASPAMLDELIAVAHEVNRPARVHLKVDTGLGRGGAAMADWPDLLASAAKAVADGTIEIIGVWSHFACADIPDHPSIAAQLAQFDDALAAADHAGVRPQIRHIANSAATLTVPQSHFDVVRPGISLYGYSPIPGQRSAALKPAMTLRASVMLTKRVPAGQGVSYGYQYFTEHETTLAVVPLGYADGVPRSATNSGPLWLAGSRRRIAGRVCMDQFIVDVGDDPVSAGDDAVLFGPGDNGEPTADDWAEVLDTISYEIVSRVGVRVPRTYVGTEIGGK